MIPINFLLSLVCLLLLVKRWQAGSLWRFLLLLCCVHSLGSGMAMLFPGGKWHTVLPVSGAMLPVVCTLALARQQQRPLHYRWASLPVILMAASVAFLPQAIDLLMPLIWLGSACTLLWYLRRDAAAGQREQQALSVNTWRLLALLLTGIALLDVAVSLLIAFAGGAGIQGLLFAGNVLVCAALSLALVLAPAQPGTAQFAQPAPRQPQEGDDETLARIEQLMTGGIYRRSDVTLALLARKAGIPARRVSAAINARHQQSVSRYINDWRIREACRLLSSSGETVIEVMAAVGFETKSNFNREFRRITGMTPTQWRQQASEQAEMLP